MRKGAIKQAEKTCKSQPAEGCNQGAIRVQLGRNQGAKGCNPKSLQKHTKTCKRGEEDEKRAIKQEKKRAKANRLKSAIRVQLGYNQGAIMVDRLQDLLAIRLPFLAKVSFQILLTRPAADKDRVELALNFLSAVDRKAHGTMMAADRALAAAGRHANKAEDCWKELPETWPRRRPSGTLRTRTTAASCGASFPLPWGRRAHLAGAVKDRELLGLLLAI